jgi:hypothetical protein
LVIFPDRLSFRSRLAFPKRAAAYGLRADVFATRLRAQHGGIATLAKITAGVAAAWTINGRPELRRHGPRASILLGEIEQHGGYVPPGDFASLWRGADAGARHMNPITCVSPVLDLNDRKSGNHCEPAYQSVAAARIPDDPEFFMPSIPRPKVRQMRWLDCIERIEGSIGFPILAGLELRIDRASD